MDAVVFRLANGGKLAVDPTGVTAVHFDPRIGVIIRVDGKDYDLSERQQDVLAELGWVV